MNFTLAVFSSLVRARNSRHRRVNVVYLSLTIPACRRKRRGETQLLIYMSIVETRHYNPNHHEMHPLNQRLHLGTNKQYKLYLIAYILYK